MGIMELFSSKGGPKKRDTMPPINSTDPKAYEETSQFARDLFAKSEFENQQIPSFLSQLTGKLFDKYLLPPYGKNLIPLENLQDKGTRLAIIFLAMQILGSLDSTDASAGTKKKMTPQAIEWAKEAMKKIDPIEYLLYKRSEKGSVDDNYEFDEDDKKLLTWNLYHEIRSGLDDDSGGTEGILGVVYSVFERMESKNYPPEAKAVILQQSQYSWTLEILKDLENKKIDTESFVRLRALIDNLTNENFKVEHQKLKRYIEIFLNKNKPDEEKITLPENLNDYHLYGMLNDKSGIHYELTNKATKERILKAEEIYLEDIGLQKPRVVLLGSHLHYSSQLIEKLIIKDKKESAKKKVEDIEE
jgi:hypothetical protein